MAQMTMGPWAQPKEEDPLEKDKKIVQTFLDNIDLAKTYDEDQEEDKDYLKWKEEVLSKSPEEQKEMLYAQLKKVVSENDAKCLDRILEILKDPANENANTDLVYIETELKKIEPAITPLVVAQYMMLLYGCGLVTFNN